MLKERTTVAASLCFCIGILLGVNADGVFFTLLISIFGVLCLALVTAHHFFGFKVVSTAIIIAAAIVGVLYVKIYGLFAFGGFDDLRYKDDSITASVVDIDDYADESELILKIISSDAGLKKGTRVCIRVGSSENIRIGDTLDLDVKYSSLASSRLKASFAVLTGRGEISDIREGTGFLYKLRKTVSEKTAELYAPFGKDVTAVANTLIGVGKGLDTGIYAAYRNAGLSHMLVISGFHLSVIVMTFISILSMLRVKFDVRVLVGISMTLFICFFVGATPSIIRASVMVILAFILRILLRREDPLLPFTVAMCVLAVFNPFIIASVSAQLSFAACLVIICMQPLMTNIIERMSSNHAKRLFVIFAAPAIISFSVNLLTLPITMSFGCISYIAPITNVLVSFAFSLFVPLEILSVILFAIFGSSLSFLAYPAGWFFTELHKILRALYSRGIGSVSTNVPYFEIAVALTFAAAAVLLITEDLRKRTRRSFICLGLAFVTLIALAAVHGIYLSHNTVLFFREDKTGGECLVTDRGANSFIDLGGYGSAQSFAESGIISLENYIIPGVDKYSVSKFSRAASSLYIKNLYLPIDTDPDTVIKLTEIAESIGCRVTLTGGFDATYDGRMYFNRSTVYYGKDVCILFGDECLGCDCKVAFAMSDFAPLEDEIYIADTLVSDISDRESFKYNHAFSTDRGKFVSINITKDREVKPIEH